MVLKKIIQTFEKDKKKSLFSFKIIIFTYFSSPILRFIVNSFFFVNLDFKWSLDVTIFFFD
jgi:hypothetical protein